MSHTAALANAAAGHPVRRMLPPPSVVRFKRARAPGEDVRLFAMTFVAGFIVFYGMIL